MPFGAETTTTEVLTGVDLSGCVAVVTGASGGLGLETARSLAAAGAEVVLAARDREKGAAALDTIRASVADARVHLGLLDLASLASVRSFAAALLDGRSSIDLVINNAGVMATPFQRTADGFELQLGTNHLGHFLLTTLLTPLLLAAAPARVVNLSSRGHTRSDIHWDDPHYRSRPYDKWEAYGQSKTANVLFSVELDRRLGDDGVRAYAVHPGVIATELARYLSADDFADMRSRAPAGALQLKPVEAGAATTVWAATAPELADQGGVYLEDCRIGTPEPYALDPDSAARLWTWSEAEVGLTAP